MSRVQIKVARKFVPHTLLLNAAFEALTASKIKTVAYWWDWLSAILYSSLSIEAIGNAYGETFITRWSDFESASPLAKIRVVAEHCGITPDFSRHPWAIVPELISFRNRIAHAKVENLSIDMICDQEDYEHYLYAKPESKIEKIVTKAFAHKSYESVYEILALLAEKLPLDKVAEIEFEMWHGGSSWLADETEQDAAANP